MRSPARTATKTPRPSSPRPQQQQQPPPPPPWRLWFVGLLCAFALVVVIERGGGGAATDPILNEPIGPESNPQLRRRKKPRVSLTKQAKNYLTKHARLPNASYLAQAGGRPAGMAPSVPRLPLFLAFPPPLISASHPMWKRVMDEGSDHRAYAPP